MKIITLSLNPAFDIHCDIPDFTPYHENLAHITSNDAGGKGINISRALCENGVENLAFVILGDENGAAFEQALVRDGLNFRKLTVKGRIRENITCHTPGVPETRISFEGFCVDQEQMELVYQQLVDEVDGDTIVTFSGRAPAGVDVGSVKDLLGRFARQGARLVIDSRSFTLADLRDMRPWLIKPNQEEISGYLEREITDFEQVAAAAQQLRGDGIENVMVSLGAQGALLACDEGLFTASAPAVEVRSTVGAGDSMIAGFLAAEAMLADSQTRLRTAVAYGSAACMTQGTRPPKPADILRILPDVQVKRL
jgi:1-phosphofructokinase family hexose kinase